MSRKPTVSRETTAALSDAAVRRPTFVAQPRVKVGAKKIGMTLFFPPQTHARLKEIANARKTSLQQLVAQALDEWLARENEPPFYPNTEDQP